MCVSLALSNARDSGIQGTEHLPMPASFRKPDTQWAVLQSYCYVYLIIVSKLVIASDKKMHMINLPKRSFVTN